MVAQLADYTQPAIFFGQYSQQTADHGKSRAHFPG
ncbi:hypothetical protein ABID28_001853, partial [Streptococcus porcorum]